MPISRSVRCRRRRAARLVPRAALAVPLIRPPPRKRPPGRGGKRLGGRPSVCGWAGRSALSRCPPPHAPSKPLTTLACGFCRLTPTTRDALGAPPGGAGTRFQPPPPPRPATPAALRAPGAAPTPPVPPFDAPARAARAPAARAPPAPSLPAEAGPSAPAATEPAEYAGDEGRATAAAERAPGTITPGRARWPEALPHRPAVSQPGLRPRHRYRCRAGGRGRAALPRLGRARPRGRKSGRPLTL